MKRHFPLAALAAASSCLLAIPRAAHAQKTNTGTIILRVTADTTPIRGAAIAAGSVNAVTDQSGSATFKLPVGTYTFRMSPAGYRPESLTVFVGVGTTKMTFPMRNKPLPPPRERPVVVSQEGRPSGSHQGGPAAETRLDDRRVNEHRKQEAPTNVEIADRLAIDEQLDRSPGTIDELLSRLPGVRVQPLSAGAAGAAIRIRGMPGRYTKFLVDGLPLTGAATEGLEAFQTSALGLDRVEVTPGVTSALYGPTSLGGSVNVVSAAPTSPSEVVMNGTTREASDIGVFQTHTFSPTWAATLLAGRHYQNASDPDADGWAEINGYKRVIVRPRVYWSRSPQSSWFMTGGWTSENRRSGTFGSAGHLPSFQQASDDADTRRGDAGTVGRIQLDSNTFVTVRASMTREWRTRWLGDEREGERRNEVFGDVSIATSLGQHLLAGGIAMDRDQFTAQGARELNYRYTTPALHAEHTWTPERWIGVTSAARLDLHSEFGDFVSPRVSVVLRPSDAWFVRVSRANGVYAPTPLTDETATYGLSNLRYAAREAEHALGWTMDAGTARGDLELGGSVYRTVVSHPLALRPSATSLTEFEIMNADDPLRIQGVDAYVRYPGRPFRFSARYSYADAMRPEISQILGDGFEFDSTALRAAPYTPRHSADVTAAYERENGRTIGLDVHFTGTQRLADSSLGASHPYATIDAHVEQHVRRAILFVRAKNLTGVHQAQFAPVMRRESGPGGAWTDNVWAPLEGRVINAGLRVVY